MRLVWQALKKILKQMHCEPANVGFNDLKKVRQPYFCKPRQDGSSHAIFKTLLAVLKSLGMRLSVEPENHAHA